MGKNRDYPLSLFGWLYVFYYYGGSYPELNVFPIVGYDLCFLSQLPNACKMRSRTGTVCYC
jgi:hypothetical protein